MDNFEDRVEFLTEGYKCVLELKAFKPQAIVYFEPIVNFGCVVQNAKKTEAVEFINEGVQDITIEFRLEKQTELSLSVDKLELKKSPHSKKDDKTKNKATLYITFE